MKNEQQIKAIEAKIDELKAEVEKLKEKPFDIWSIVPVDTPVIVSEETKGGYKKYFAENEMAFDNGTTSRTNSFKRTTRWKNMRLDSEADNIYAYTEHDGGGCPVESYQIVKVIFRTGHTAVDEAKTFHWNHRNENGDIILYSIVK